MTIKHEPTLFERTDNLSAREVMDATMKAVESIRFSDSLQNIYSLAKDISECTKNNTPEAFRNSRLKDMAEVLYVMDTGVLQSKIAPAVYQVINTSSTVPQARKDKACKQFAVVVATVVKAQQSA